MWKKNEARPYTPLAPTQPTSVSQPERSRSGLATIGPSITIKGELTGQEDLEVQGKVEGSITLKKHRVLVSESGRVNADIHAKSIRVGGEVKGNLLGEDEVIILHTGRVEGDIKASRVTLEDGSKFKGAIDMEPKGDQKESSASAEASTTKKAQSPENGRLTDTSLRHGSSSPA
ncbi:MAG TPA: polymer-forming cytoskeletal protein [Vicinamibacteria bacterium]|jgi:cytoskeletal protein CcmA (bactofilin family)